MEKDNQKKCTDCDKGATMILSDQGDGNCSRCHGTGKHLGFIDSMTNHFGLTEDEGECGVCSGTGQCQTCGGTGYEFDDD